MGVRLFVIERSYDVWLVLTTRCRNLIPMTSFCGSGLCPGSPTVALHVLLNLGHRSCADVLTQDGQRYNKPLNLVPRGTQISYLAAVDLVAELGVSQVRLLVLRLVARLRDFVGHNYYFTLPIGECKHGGELLRIELMMSSAR
ncbi:hypothetical protein M9H77_36373 [Catharanthus roseus]|uniref:Uncharacterized protein n=1 Tax=Catharanthus roseus TaxID=4058 RepID=A0ACB9ZSG1_CATRO|nr:hypothetical protein M9H77_36373 [Catharanthus roseus]